MPTTFAGSMLKAWYIIDYKLVKWQICLEKSFFGFGNSKWVEDLISSTNIPLMFIDRCKIILIGSPHLFTNFCFLNSWQHVLGYKSRCSARSSKCFGHRFSEHLLLSQFKKWYHRNENIFALNCYFMKNIVQLQNSRIFQVHRPTKIQSQKHEENKNG